MINQEVGKQRFDLFKKKALMVFTTALRLPLMLLMGCGYAVDSIGMRREVHDHRGVKEINIGVLPTEYKEEEHGKLIEWVEEGQPIPSLASRNHSHKGRSASGPYEF